MMACLEELFTPVSYAALSLETAATAKSGLVQHVATHGWVTILVEVLEKLVAASVSHRHLTGT